MVIFAPLLTEQLRADWDLRRSRCLVCLEQGGKYAHKHPSDEDKRCHRIHKECLFGWGKQCLKNDEPWNCPLCRNNIIDVTRSCAADWQGWQTEVASIKKWAKAKKQPFIMDRLERNEPEQAASNEAAEEEGSSMPLDCLQRLWQQGCGIFVQGLRPTRYMVACAMTYPRHVLASLISLSMIGICARDVFLLKPVALLPESLFDRYVIFPVNDLSDHLVHELSQDVIEFAQPWLSWVIGGALLVPAVGLQIKYPGSLKQLQRCGSVVCDALKRSSLNVIKAARLHLSWKEKHLLQRHEAIIHASENNDVALLRQLLNKGAEISEECRGLAIEIAAEKGSVECLKELLIGHPFFLRVSLIRAVLSAAQAGHKECLNELLAGNQSISAGELDNAIQLSQVNGHSDCHRLLLALKRRASIKDEIETKSEGILKEGWIDRFQGWIESVLSQVLHLFQSVIQAFYRAS